MIPYFDGLLQEEKEELTAAIRLIERQTYVLERKYDRKTGRFQYEKEYRVLERHMEFLRAYLEISGIGVCEDVQLGVIYIRGEAVMAEKLSRLATLYLLLLKVIYDEQMAEASNELSVRITLGELNERLGAFRLAERTAPTEVKRALSLLKKYQILEPLDPVDELDGSMRLIIYPTVSLVLTGNDMRELLEELGDRAGEKEPERTGEESGEEAEAGEEPAEETGEEPKTAKETKAEEESSK